MHVFLPVCVSCFSCFVIFFLFITINIMMSIEKMISTSATPADTPAIMGVIDSCTTVTDPLGNGGGSGGHVNNCISKYCVIYISLICCAISSKNKSVVR